MKTIRISQFKVLIFSVVLALSAFVATQAQSSNLKNSTPEERAKMQSDMMKEKLALTDEQCQKVSTVNLKYARQMDALKNDGGGRFAKMRKAKSAMGDKDGELEKIFTPEQFEKYKTFKKEMMDKAKENYKSKKG
ncbi:hypothetical protein [Foetidibacter luteolus]|uniref:hypothetical protein n=1 Tax=Foetidibacter luteolus TaxID=2608880 RepID=UPI00129AA7D9|nr:hypothetical protein [Foetidibacter luteolus]